MPLRQIPVACVQLAAHDRHTFDATFPHAVALVERAAREGARLIVVPEGTVPAYVLGDEPVDRAQIERADEEFARVARTHGATIVFGCARTTGGRTYNTATVIGPDGRVLDAAPKQFLWHFDRRWFAAGERLEPIETPLGKLGVLVCADGRIPTIAATLVERGAEILVMSTAWVTSGRDPNALENVQADLFAMVRAKENGVPFVASNKCGVELGCVAYCGKSVIVAADGSIVARASERDEMIVHGKVTIGGDGEVSQHLAIPPSFTRIAPHHSIDTDRPGDIDAVPESASLVPRSRARIAITLEYEPHAVSRSAELAAIAEADLLIACGDPATPPDQIALLTIADASERETAIVEIAGVRAGIAGDRVFEHPRGLADARLHGIDLFIWNAGGDSTWHERVARTRAAETRSYVVVLARDTGRAFACDPDGAIVCGTFDGFRMAAFVYDRERTAATLVAPGTDVLDGLRIAEAIRSEGPALAARAGAAPATFA